MKQPCCPGMNNSYGAHIHLSTRQIWGEGPGREMRPRFGEAKRPRPRIWASRLEWNGRRRGGRRVVLGSALFDLGPVDGPLCSSGLGPKLKIPVKLTDCHLNQPACVCRTHRAMLWYSMQGLGSGCVWVET